MSESNRSDHTGIIVTAFVTFLLIFALIGYFQGLEKGQTDRAEINAQEHHENTADYIQTSCVGRDHAAFVECVDKAIKTSGEYQRAEYDLAAQQQMAKFAKWLLAVTLITTGVTGLGVYYVKRTLDQTAATNTAALAASIAANETNTIMRQERRPWVVLRRDFDCDFFDHGHRCTMAWNHDFENLGKTPAYALRLRTKVFKIDTLQPLRRLLSDFVESEIQNTRTVIDSPIIFAGERTEHWKYYSETRSHYASGISVNDGRFTIMLTCLTYQLGIDEKDGIGVEAMVLDIDHKPGFIGPFGHTLLEHETMRIVK